MIDNVEYGLALRIIVTLAWVTASIVAVASLVLLTALAQCLWSIYPSL